MHKNFFENIAIIGSSGSIGGSFVNHLEKRPEVKMIYGFSRKPKQFKGEKLVSEKICFDDENSIFLASEIASRELPLDLVIVATGLLHNNQIMPEKSLKDLSEKNFKQLFLVNTIAPSLIVKHFLPKLNKNRTSILAVLSARVGSISDNSLGGWYSYRASKAALNMVLKSASIELSRTNKNCIIVALHPGTVDSNLSKPFQKFVNKEKLFSTDFSTSKMLKIIYNLNIKDTGKIFAWDGSEIFTINFLCIIMFKFIVFLL